MNPIAILVCVSCVALAAAAPQGYSYEQQQQQQVRQQVLPVGNLRPQVPVSTSGIYSVSQAPTFAQFQQNGAAPLQLQAPQQQPQVLIQHQQQPQQVGQPAVFQQPPQFVQNVVQHSQGPQQFVQQPQQHQQQQRAAIVTKDIYIHSAPEDTEEFGGGEQFDNLPVRKNYRIVFIKAPSQNLKHTAAALKRAQSSNEEKTVIYVLSKKPDLNEIQQQLQSTQSESKVHKPEVYFIKYKTQEEAHRAQQEIQAQYDALGGATHISDEGIAPLTTISNGSLNLNSVVPHHIQSQVIAAAQPQIQTQTQSSFSQSTQQFGGNFQSSGNSYAAPSRTYVPAKTK